MQITHKITRIERGETSNSKSPMWRCTCDDGSRVNIFKHSDPAKNSFATFEVAGYGDLLISMQLGEIAIWNTHPIGTVLIKNGQWWEIVGVAEKPVGAQPDPSFKPNLEQYRSAVIDWATGIIGLSYNTVVWDTETTGLEDDDEIIEIAIVDINKVTVFQSLIKPVNIDRLSRPITKDGYTIADLTGITPEMLANAPTFPEVYEQVRRALLTSPYSLIYNAPFDTLMLERNCHRHGLPPIMPLFVGDVMEKFAQFYGEWDYAKQRFVSKKLEFAALELGIVGDNAHRALADALTTVDVIKSMAEQTNL